MKAYKSAGRLKAGLFIVAIALILGALIYTQSLVSRLRSDVREFLNFYAEVYAKAASEFQGEDYSFIFEQIIQRINFPIIISSKKDSNPTAWKNVGVDPGDMSAEAIERVTDRMQTMDKSTNPIPLTYNNMLLGYIHYGDSRMIRELQWLPYIEIFVVAMFILIGYLGYQTIRRSEQRLIWVGMARETAHQLGTPISSLLGWIELLNSKDLSDEMQDVVGEMRQDVNRLEQVTARFSQISSEAHLSEVNLRNILESLVEYTRRRLPQTGKSVKLQVEGDTDITLSLNTELISWTLENLIKNGIDAIDTKQGKITVQIEQPDENKVVIDVTDTGKGIGNSSDRSNIFKPGFSTKKRGWGLGLSLAKRIIEEYHHGELELAWTEPGKGTTLRITLFRDRLEDIAKRRHSGNHK